ncbi:putative reverse transcriptase domain-containing protein [Tanacetum coccineum]
MTSSNNQMHNDIMAVGSKERPPMLASGSYAQWKSRFMRYVDTKPNRKLLRNCIYEGPYEITLVQLEDTPSDDENLRRPGEILKETYGNTNPENRKLINVEAEAVHMILNEIGNDIYCIVDACPNAEEMWIAIERLQQGESINIQDVKTKLFWEFGKFTSKDGESIESYYTRFYRMMNEMDTDDEPDEQKLEAHYMYMAKIQEVLHTTYDNFEPIFDTEPLEKSIENADLKAQLQDKTTVNTEMRSLLNKMNEKSVDFRFQKPLVLGKPSPFGNSLERQILPKSRPQLRSIQMKDKVVQNNSQLMLKKKEVEDHHRISNFSTKTKFVTARNDSLNTKTSNVKVVCVACGKCVFNSNHDACVSKFINDVNARTKKPNVVPISTRKPIMKANQSVATSHKKTVALESTIQKSRSCFRMLYEKTSKMWTWWIEKQCPSRYKWKPKSQNDNMRKCVKLPLDNASRSYKSSYSSECHDQEGLLRRRSQSQFILVSQFCDADLEVAFRKSTCFVRDLQGNDLLMGTRGSNLYTIALQESSSPTLICFIAKASLTQSWLWHRRFSHLNFDTINLHSNNNIVNGLPKLKYLKDQLLTKTVPSSKGQLHLLCMDLCGPMRIESINRKKYILVIVDDYSRYTWTHFLRFKDETLEVLIDFLKMIQRGLHAQVITVRTNRGTEFLNKTLQTYFKEGISHQTTIAQTPEQNGVVERRNCTLVEVARTMLLSSKLPLFFWAKSIATVIIFVISVSSDSSEESVRTSTGRVILFGTIPTTIPDTTPFVIPPTTHIDTTPIPTVSPTIPPSPDYTPASPDYSPASDTEFDPSEDLSSDHIPPLPVTSAFLSSTDDSSDSDTPDTPPSPTHGTPFTETTLSTQRSPVAFGALRRRVMVLAPGQPIPHGRPYRYHLNGSVHMMTARKRVGPLPTHRLAVRYSVDYSSSDHFSSDDSSSSSSSETSLDSSADALSDSASSRSSSDHSLPTPSSGMRPSHHLCSLVPSIHRSSTAISERPSHDSSSASPSRKRSRSPAASVPLSSPTLGSFSYARANLLSSPKRIRSSKTATDLEGCSEDSFEPYVPREAGLGVDFVDESSESSRHRGTDLEMDVDVVRSDGIDIDPEIQAEIDECIAYADALRDRGIDARVVVKAIDREEIEMSMRGLVEVRVDRVTHPVATDDIPEPTQEGAVEVKYETLGDLVQRFHDHTEEILVHRVQRRELRVQRDMRQIRHFRFYDRIRIARLVLGGIWLPTMPNTPSGASRTLKGINEQIDRQMAGALGARTTSMNLEPLMRDGGGQKEVNGNGGMEMELEEMEIEGMEMEETKMVIGTEEDMAITLKDLLTRWFEKMETVFYISNCLEKYQVKYALCTLLNSALTWWNSHKRTIRIEAAYTMSWAELMKLMTKVYCPRNEVQKIEIEMVPNEKDKVERFVGGLPDNIQGNVIVTPPDGAWTEYVSGGVTSSYFEHKARENDH